MKPLPFTYHRPTSRFGVGELLAQYGGEAKILAGGQSLIPLLNLRLVAPGHLIDVNDLASETTEPQVENGWLTIGPLVRHAGVERSALAEQAAPLLAEAIRSIGHPAIRSRGTVLGSVAHADPSAELPAVLLLLDGEAVVSGPGGAPDGSGPRALRRRLRDVSGAGRMDCRDQNSHRRGHPGRGARGVCSPPWRLCPLRRGGYGHWRGKRRAGRPVLLRCRRPPASYRARDVSDRRARR